LLPQAGPTGRLAAVFGALALIGWILQCGFITASNGTDARTLFLSLCGLPLIVFLAGILLLQTLGQPKVGDKVDYQWRIGAIIALVLMPMGWLFLVLVLAIF
jgi:hypothetical protein